MPSANLAALNARSTPFRAGASGNFTGSVSGTFVATVRLERRTQGNVDTTVGWEPVARDLAGNFVVYTAPSGSLPMKGSYSEPDAELSWVVTAYTSGTVVARLGA